MNVRYRVELSQTERTELTELLSGGKQCGTQAQAGADIVGGGWRRQRRGDRDQCRRGQLDRLSD